MNHLTCTPRLIVLALLGGVLFAAAQPQPTTNAPVVQSQTAAAPRREIPTMESRLQQIVSTQFARVMTEEQRVKYREAMDANREKVQVLQVKLRTARKEMLDLQLAEKFDEAAFRIKAETAAGLQAQMELLNAQAFAKIRPSMTDEQIDKIKNQPVMNRAYGGSEVRPGVFSSGAIPAQVPSEPTPKTPSASAAK